MTNIIDLLAFKAAFDDQGVYPVKVIQGDTVTERTEWQDGWNAARLDLIKNWKKAAAHLKALPDELQSIVETMILKGVLHLDISADKVEFSLNMNDVFYYACADEEIVDSEELPLVFNMWTQFHYDGLIAWAAYKRQEQPIEELLSKEFTEASEFLNACGHVDDNNKLTAE